MSKKSLHRYTALGILAIIFAGSGILYVSSPTLQHTPEALAVKAPATEAGLYPGDHVVVFLDEMRVELKNGTTTLVNMKIITKGKPGSYYETIGGAYENDYKIKNHFSSFGQVYLPWSVHVFGNFFIHGIPYYPNREKVSSTYSGGCIRLTDEDAKRVYDFVSRGTPIILVGKDIKEWNPTATSTATVPSMDLTRYMAAVVSLEVLPQDNDIRGVDGAWTTRRKLIPKLLLEKNDAAIGRFAHALGDATFIEYMNKKALSLGLTNTSFGAIDGPATTTPEDYVRFMKYVKDYKSYLAEMSSSTPLLSQ